MEPIVGIKHGHCRVHSVCTVGAAQVKDKSKYASKVASSLLVQGKEDGKVICACGAGADWMGCTALQSQGASKAHTPLWR
eukprot:1147824-Pelagomonas_calceolata.AAC.2